LTNQEEEMAEEEEEEEEDVDVLSDRYSNFGNTYLGGSSLNTWHSARSSSDVTICPGPKSRANSFDK
jgi:hypothetical protein